ncbi:MAG TPA: cob(I)yrinic acid a,c-diamide adenosyltransferase [Chloroflexota bacterium]|nr:cob(I)yrinic acid a,c-diamide adenosyltransferase [Chloroflexota bacterium]
MMRWGSGDDGSTGLFGHGRVPKDSLRTETYGAIDEATSCLGVAKCAGVGGRTRDMVEQVQRDLYVLMGELASTDEYRAKLPAIIGGDQCAQLDAFCAEIEQHLSLPNQFLLPGGCTASAQLDLARATVRRAERACVRLFREGGATVSDSALRYLNRLSTLLYLLARAEDARAGVLPSLTKPAR